MRRRRLNPVCSALLVLLLVVTGQSMAVARGAAAATGQMSICIGAETKTVYVDAQGNPTAPPHLCPDCVLIFAEAGFFDPLSFDAPATVQMQRFRNALDIVQGRLSGFLSRAPPALA